MALHSRYTEGVHDELNYLATWLPTVLLAPGDVCTLEDLQLQKVGTLADFGIAFEAKDAPVKTDFEYSSADEVSIDIKAAGQAPIAGSALAIEDAGLTVRFANAGAVLLRLAGCTSRQIANLHAVGQQVLALHRQDQWPEGYVVITETVTAGASTILISQGKDASLDLSAKGGVQAGTVTLASLDAGLQVKRETRIGAKFIAESGLTPLVLASGVRKRFLRPDDFRTREAPQGETAAFDFVAVDYPVAAGSSD